MISISALTHVSHISYFIFHSIINLFRWLLSHQGKQLRRVVLCVVAMRKALLHAINTDAAGDSDEWRAVATQLKVRG